MRVHKLRVSRVVAADTHAPACLMQAEPVRTYRRQELLFQLDELVHGFLVRHQRISRVLVVVVVVIVAVPQVREVMVPVRRVSVPFGTMVVVRMSVRVAVCVAVHAAVTVRVSALVAFPEPVALRVAVRVASWGDRG